MTQPILEYAGPPKFKYEWRFLRGTVAVGVFVGGWLLFSGAVWLMYGNWGVGHMPLLVYVRLSAFPAVAETSLVLSAINLLWLLVLLIYCRPSWRHSAHYVAFAFLPLALLFLIEVSIFGPFIVE